MSILAALEGIAAAVNALTPSVDVGIPFRRHSPEARSSMLTAGAQSRVFELVAGPPGLSERTSDATATHYVYEVEVRLMYGLAAWRSWDALALAMASDLADIAATLRTPATWSAWAHELYPREDRIARDDIITDDGETAGYVVTLPVTLHLEV